MAPVGLTLALLASAAQFFVSSAFAQNRAFQWKFGGNFVQTDLEACQNISVIVESIGSNASDIGVAPWYFLAFELQGVPTTTNLGSDSGSLSWQVRHQPGSSLMLTMMDANGNTGGVGPSFFNVTAGSDTSCLPSSPSASLPHITPNVTDTLQTCQPWGLTITNGTMPYNITLAALDSPVVTIVPMGPQNDVFTYIDRANPNGQLIAAVSDANGWGYTTLAVRTAGSSNNSCVGLVSSSSTVAQIAAEESAQAAAEAAAQHRHRNALIIGLTVGLGVPFLAACAAAAWWFQRRAQRDRGIWDGQDANPRAYDGPAQPRTAASSHPMREAAGASKRALVLAMGHARNASHNASAPLLAVPQSPSPEQQAFDEAHAQDPASPRTRKGRRRLRQQQQQQASDAGSSGASGSGPSDAQSLAASFLAHFALGRSTHTLSGGDPDVEPDIIIQHRDGGVVHELPPPYLERARRASAQHSRDPSPTVAPPPPRSLPTPPLPHPPVPEPEPEPDYEAPLGDS